jgi:hypothetical protein
MKKRDLTDAELLLAAMCVGVARWEPFQGRAGGEVCVRGMRWSTHVDDRGVPLLSEDVAVELRQALGRKQ